MKKTKRILALIGAILLVCMYLSTLFFALSGSDNATNMLMASIACTIIVPVLLYAYILIYRVTNKKDSKEADAKKNITSITKP